MGMYVLAIGFQFATDILLFRQTHLVRCYSFRVLGLLTMYSGLLYLSFEHIISISSLTPIQISDKRRLVFSCSVLECEYRISGIMRLDAPSRTGHKLMSLFSLEDLSHQSEDIYCI